MISTPRVGLEFNKGWLDYLVQTLSEYSDSVKDDYPDMYYAAQKLIYDIDKYRVEIPKNGHNVDYVDLPEPEVSDVIFMLLMCITDKESSVNLYKGFVDGCKNEIDDLNDTISKSCSDNHRSIEKEAQASYEHSDNEIEMSRKDPGHQMIDNYIPFEDRWKGDME